MKTAEGPNNARMPRHTQEEKFADYFRKLDKDLLYRDCDLFKTLDEDLLEEVEYEFERVLDEILEDIEYLKMPRESQEEAVKECISILWEDHDYIDKRLLEVLDEDLLEQIYEEQSIIVEDLQHEIYELSKGKKN